ncbi:MAG: MFS transporter [Acidobacteria bacterium]|nr:MFS transporter [Acidobacteriota bacterium]
MKNPLRKVFDISKEELPVVVLLFAFFFLVIVDFQMLRPLKKGLFLEHYGAKLELYAKLANILVAGLGVAAFTYLYNKLPRQRLIYSLCIFFIASFVWLGFAVSNPTAVPVWGFYLLGDLETTLLVAGFWAYATDLSSSDQAKRLFGVIGGGGVIGGLVGVSLTKILFQSIGTQGLLFVAAGFMAAVILVTFLAESWVSRSETFRKVTRAQPSGEGDSGKKSKMAAAIEGAQLVLKSPYLAAIVGFMAFYEMASQVMDFQLGHLGEALQGAEATQAFYADVGFYANGVAVVTQFFLVSLIMRKLGVTAALLVLPLVILGSSGTFLVMPSLLVASFFFISENGLNYSIQQTARESLYVVTTPDEKYKARAFTNMFVQRLAKGISIFLLMGLLALKVEINLMSLVTIVVGVLMILFSLYAGREFVRKSKAEPGRSEAA